MHMFILIARLRDKHTYLVKYHICLYLFANHLHKRDEPKEK